MARDDRQREHEDAREAADGIHETRDEPKRDRDRILYSAEFRRLAGITQVASASEIQLLHNRLTHSLKVAQIGRRMVERLRDLFPITAAEISLNEDVVETAGLAHDLGHPPFGHIAEEELAEIATKHGAAFDGNAQTFRIVTKLSRRKAPIGQDPAMRGLDLTRATLNAILKYPAFSRDTLPTASLEDRSKATHWGVYDTEEADFTFARTDSTRAFVRSPEAILMDWADDVSYATHDIEDYVRAGRMPLQDIEKDAEQIVAFAARRLRAKRVQFDTRQLENALQETVPALWPRWEGSFQDEYRIRTWVSQQITRFGNAVTLTKEPPYVRIEPAQEYEVEMLKALTWFYVISSPPLAAAQEGQRRLIRGLFDNLLDWAEKRPSALPVTLRQLIATIREEEAPMLGFDTAGAADEYAVARAVTDYISSLTEVQAVDLYERISGVSPASTLGAWL